MLQCLNSAAESGGAESGLQLNTAHIVCHLYYYLPPRNDADKTGTSAVSVSSFDLPKEFFQMLTACGPYLHRDTQLLQKVT